MIWNSIPLMSTIDILIVLSTVLLARTAYIYRAPIQKLGLRSGFNVILFGLIVTAVFYLSDLLVMNRLGLSITRSESMDIMTNMHLNLSWSVTFISIAAISLGMALVIRKVIPQATYSIADLEEQVASRTKQLETANSRLGTQNEKLSNAEKELRESELKLRTIYNSSKDPIVVARNKKLILVNKAFREMFRYKSTDRLLGKKVITLIAGHERQRVDGYMKLRAEGKGAPEKYQTRGLRNDGSLFDLEVHVSSAKFEGKLVLISILRDITKQKQSEESIAESEARFRALSAATFEGIGATFEGKVIDGNQQMADMLGYELSELIGAPVSKLVHPEDQEFVIRQIESGSEEPYEHRALRKDGEVLSLEVRGRMMDYDGDMARVTVLRDITESKSAEKKIRFQANLLENVQEGVISADLKGLITYWERGAEAMYGFTKEEMIGKSISLFLAPGEIEENKKRLQETMKNGVWRGRVEQRSKSGKEIWSDVTVSLVLNSDGIPVGYLGINTDRTDQVATESRLAQKDQEFTSIVETSQDWIWSIDLEGRHTYSNPAVFHILGYSTKEIVGGNSFDLLHKEDRILVENQLPNWVKAKTGWNNLVLRWRHKDGSWKWLESNSTPMLDENGTLLGYRGVDRDISERIRSENLLLAINKASKAMEKALTPRATFDAAAAELQKLGFASMLFPLDESGTKLLTKYVSFDSKALKAVEKLTGFKQTEFSIQLDSLTFYQKILQKKKAVFVNETDDYMRHELPSKLKKLAPRIIKILDVPKSIQAPLMFEGDAIGIFSVLARDLTEKDIPVVTAFADQVAAAFNKTRLLEELELSLRARERVSEKFSKAFTFSPSAMIISAYPDGRILEANDKFQDMFGVSEQEITNSKKITFHLWKKPEDKKNIDDQIAANGYFLDFETLANTNSKQVLNVISSFVVLDTENGQVLLTSIIDLTEIRNAEKLVRASETRYRNLFKFAADGILVMKNGVIEDSNAMAHEMTGWRQAELRGKDLSDSQLSPEIQSDGSLSVKKANKHLSLALEGNSQEIEWQVRNSDGLIIDMEVSMNPFELEKEKRVILSMRDVSETKRLAEERERLFSEVQRRQNRLQNLARQLAVLQETEREELAKELHDRVGQSLTALNISLSHAKSLIGSAQEGEAVDRIEKAQELVETTTQQVRDVMAELRPAVLDDYGLFAAINWQAGEHEKLTSVRTTVIGNELDPRLGRDKEIALFRIMQEALTNSARHGKAKNVTVSLTDGKDTVSLEVVDDGIGFDQHLKDEGWGLEIMRERAHAVFGELKLESSVGKGARVIATTPRES